MIAFRLFMAVVLLAMVLAQIGVYFLLSEDLNVFNNSSFTSFQSSYNLLRGIFKVLIPAYFVFVSKVLFYH